MSDIRLRRQIALEAAKLMYERSESEYFTAKRKAAAQLGLNFKHRPQDLPSNKEVREQVRVLAELYEGDDRLLNLRDMRLAGLRMMRLLAAFHPRLIGSTITGHVRKGSDIDIHVFSDDASAITEILDAYNYRYDVERKRVIKHNVERVFTHIHIFDAFTFELTLYGRDQVNYTFKSSVTGKAIERASISELEALITREHPHADLEAGSDEPGGLDPFMIWPLLLAPLEKVRQRAVWHPEGDALYHSLQAFELAREEYPYDQELMAAALLHDVGKAIDSEDHVAAGLEALEGTLTPREEFLITHHMEVPAYRDGTLGARTRRRLEDSEWFDDLLALGDIDQRARVPGIQVCTIEEAIEHLRRMAEDGT